ncbi:MAG: hypothetical protein AAB896_03410 [Patescibacteria group bacterium]
MAVRTERVDWLAKAKEGDAEQNERTRDDPVLAHHVATASQAAYEAAMEYETVGTREAALNNYWEAIRVGQFITRLYDADPDSHFLASWK